MESVASFLSTNTEKAFSIEILPPLRGKSIDSTFDKMRPLLDLNPRFVNITTHRREVTFTHEGGTTFSARTAKRRPGTVAIAAVLRERFGVTPVPHIISGDYSCQEIEDQLIDLSFLGITDLLVLRGDKEKSASGFNAVADGHEHASGLARQVSDFNRGVMIDGSQGEPCYPPFTFGVAGYPEKHEEAMNLTTDIAALKRKVDEGASYIVTQMCFDNERFFRFVELCREAGITVPIVPGLKPLTSLRQRSLLPRIFHIDFPDELAMELLRATTDEQVRQIGVEWGVRQARELLAGGVPCIHFYAMHASRSVERIVNEVF